MNINPNRYFINKVVKVNPYVPLTQIRLFCITPPKDPHIYGASYRNIALTTALKQATLRALDAFN